MILIRCWLYNDSVFNMLPLADLYPVLTEPYADIPEVQEGMVQIAWNHCVGQTIRRISEPAGFQDGVLRVRVPHPQWRSTLSSMRPEIIAKINRYLKRPLLNRVDFDVK